MQNEAGENVDLYIPRKCAWTNRLISAKDHSSAQINVGEVDPETGRYTGKFKTYAFSGFVRKQALSDMALAELVKRDDTAKQSRNN